MVTKCRAKNPSTCRVHGTFNALSVVTNPVTAALNLEDSKKKSAFASNLEELSEAKQIEYKDQIIYDATVSGLAELRSKMNRPSDLTFAEQVELRKREEEALRYRNEILVESPVLSESYEKYNLVVKNNSVKSYKVPVEQKARTELIDALKDVKYGTPLAIKTKTGAIIYDEAGDGLMPNAKRNRFFSLSTAFGVSTGFASHGLDGFISLKNNLFNIGLQEVDEIHILDKNVSSEAPEIVGTAYKQSSRMWQIEGDGYSYLFEGEPTGGISSNTEEDYSQDDWRESEKGLLYYNFNNPKKINHIGI